MKIYLDLEANSAINNEVISIGMVTEEGREFYSLVRPHEKLDRRIKELTNISQEEADEAPTLEEVMEQIYNFLIAGAYAVSTIEFLHFGNHDPKFLEASLSLTEDPNVKDILSFIILRCNDISKEIAKKFNRKSIGLRSAYLTMRLSSNEPTKQSHHALDDAKMLKWVYEHIDEYSLPEGASPVKVERMDLSYGKRKTKKISSKDPRDKILTATRSGVRRKQAAAIIPEINDPKYQEVPILARKITSGKENVYSNIYSAISLVYRGKVRTAGVIYDTIESIHNALDTGEAINDWVFETFAKT